MEKRKLLAGLFALPFTALAAKAATYKPSGSATFVVPNNVERIRIRSYKDGNKVIDREMSVEPGQVFRIDPV